MELTTKQGFKQTEIGLIPEDWEVVAFDKIGYFLKGKGIKKDEVVSNGNPCIRYGELYTKYDNIIKKTFSFISNEIASTSLKLKYGDLLFAGSGEKREEIGKSAVILRSDTYAGGDIVVFRGRNIEVSYLGYISNSSPVIKQKSLYGQGDAVVHIYSGGLSKIKFPLPPTLKEQKAIATALSDVDDLIVSLEGLIAKKQAIKQGAMQQLLTPPHKGGKRLPGFSGEWVEKNLGELAWFQEGPGLRKWQFTTKGIKVINITNLVNGYLDLDKTTRHISWDEFNKMYKHFEVDEHDIVVASSGNSYCKTSVVRQQDLPLVMNTSVIRFKPNSIMDYQLLLVLLKSSQFKKQIDLLITGGAQPNFGPVHLPKVFFNIPESKDEQKAIAKILSDMDTELEQLETKKAKYQQLKQGMLQELLTGNTRLV
ncbi:restriction endonuclease subunit S [Tenacibaculum maritimum]|uniref:restriction endonuclease subunit S n=1 Tax=Tenacibaculum maritimum TaxID=107401 RepID=UPI0012E420E0|nr:restriction endonuclease subunit S [Tenacibaculum maritimum]CAA0160500.1 Type I restriction enzyme, S subunit [Tenacibaculum maritimum]